MSPVSPPASCKYPRCPEYGSHYGYCYKHNKQVNHIDNLRRGTPRERGYDETWSLVRRQKLNNNPLCEECKRQGRIKIAEEVHHIIPIAERPESRLDLDNLESLCTSCHARITKKRC